MTMEQVVFVLFSGRLRLSAVAVVSLPNPVHSVLSLVAAFVSACGLMMLLQAEFMSLLFVVVYVGAIAVLFLFVVMMLNLGSLKDSHGFTGVTAMVVLMVLTDLLLMRLLSLDVSLTAIAPRPTHVVWVDVLDSRTTLETLGQVLYTHYMLDLLLAGFVLLVARVGAIVLTLKVRQFALAKRQQVFQQLSRDADRAVLMVRARHAS